VTNVWYQPWWDASERASWGLNDRARRAGLGEHREAILTSPLCAGVVREDGYVTREERTLGRFLYLNERSDPTTWTVEHMDRMVRELAAFRPAVLEANPSFLARLARHVIARGLTQPAVDLVVFTYENPSLLHYRDVSQGFATPPASSYGSTEAGYVFMECEAGRLHQNTEYCHVDFLPFRPEHGGPSVGRILVTTFGNPWRSLVRFDIGDIVRLESAGPCPCGRTEGLVLAAVEGRTANLTLTPDGRAVTQATVDRALCQVAGLLEYQLLQSGPRAYELRFTSADGTGTAKRAAREASDRLHRIYGVSATISLEPVRAVRPDPPGKYRLTKSLVPVDGPSLVEPAYLRNLN
jgi:phenylacetate-coenzyme A ligase PaaK-like adenylate-forming protein